MLEPLVSTGTRATSIFWGASTSITAIAFSALPLALVPAGAVEVAVRLSNCSGGLAPRLMHPDSATTAESAARAPTLLFIRCIPCALTACSPAGSCP